MSPPRPTPYLGPPRHRLRWFGQLQAAGTRPRVVRSRKTCRNTWAVSAFLNVPGAGAALRVLLCFPWDAPEAVRVYAEGPTDSPHRYADQSLCMWYPYDPPDRRWIRQDGPVVLVGHVIAHLAREQWWRRTGEWVGEQAPHVATRPARRVAWRRPS